MVLLCIFCLALIPACASAVQIASYAPEASNKLSLVDAEDGQYRLESIDGVRVVVAESGPGKTQQYLYFRVADDLRGPKHRDLWLAVKFHDEALGEAAVHYNSTANPYAPARGFLSAGVGKWRTAVAKLADALPAASQNGGGDLRIMMAGRLPIAKLTLYDSEPEDLVRAAEEDLDSIPKNAPRPPGMSYCFGNDAWGSAAALYRLLGVTSIESYVTWETVEGRGQGMWDWSRWDAQVDQIRKAHLKWVPFLIVGPAYSTPDWYRASADHVGCTCLEHGITSKVESLWNPNMRKWIDRFLGEFAKRYRDSGILESVLLGIQGDFGEAIYSVWGGGWTFDIPGEYHNHAGFWCNDSYALADYRAWLERRYGSIDSLNQRWATKAASFKQVGFPGTGEKLASFRKKVSAADPASRRQWLDFVDWYRDSMTEWSSWWMQTARKHFPETDIYLCTGGDAVPEHGSNFAEQCRVAAEVGGGVRITNEASNYGANYSVTRWVASAGKHYGAYFGFEPAGAEDHIGVGARIYNATASGAKQLHDYNPNIVQNQKSLEAQRRLFPYLFHVKHPVVPVALWYPNVHLTLQWGGFLEKAAAIRDLLDYDFVDETMLRTGALDGHKLLLINMGTVMETADAELIAGWVKRGGKVIVCGVSAFQSVEGSDAPERLLFGGGLPEGSVTRIPEEGLAAALKEAAASIGLPGYDFAANNVFQTQISPNEMLELTMSADSSSIERKGR